MPLYEYKCETCGTVFELIQRFSDAPLEVHEGCGGHVERLMGTPALHFKGSGWYVNDYGKKTGAPPPGSNGKPAATTESSAKSTTPAPAPAPAAPAPAADKK